MEGKTAFLPAYIPTRESTLDSKMFKCNMIEIICKKCYSINGELKINVVNEYYSIAIDKIM